MAMLYAGSSMNTELPASYLDYPHFTVGRVDQWGEQGYLLYQGKVYCYEEDRKNQYGTTHSPCTIGDFWASAERLQIAIPSDFMACLQASLKNQD
jgi:hypothetical protein